MAFLLAGLLPASLLIGAVGWYQDGRPAIIDAVGRLAHLKDLSHQTLILLSVALAFYGARSYLLAFLQTLPSPPLPRGLRHLLLRRQIMQARVARRRVVALEAQLALYYWTGLCDDKDAPEDEACAYIDKNLAFLEAPAPPRWLLATPHPLTPTVREASRKARDTLASLASWTDTIAEPSRSARECVADALLQLRFLTANPNVRRGASEEVNVWRSFLLSTPEALPILVRFRRSIRRELNDAYLRSRRFPDEQWIQPTRIGNRLAALDDYASKRYGIDTSTLLIRIWGVTTAEEQKDVADAQLSVETFLTVAAAFLVLASSVIVIWWRRELIQPYVIDWRTIGTILGATLLSIASYRASVTAFGAVEERILRLVDFKRLAVLEAFGYAAPETVAEERNQLEELRAFFTMGQARSAERRLKPTTTSATTSAAAPDA
jgi:hypothetical protein